MNPRTKRAVVNIDVELFRALRTKAAETGQSVSALVNESLRQLLAEETEDLAAFEERAKEQDLSFEDVVQNLSERQRRTS